jgi:hypothetical protein
VRIPKQIKIGRKWYTVEVVKFSDKHGTMGNCDYNERTITVATHSTLTRKRYKSEDVDDTFWHEVVHCILKDMDHKLESNEKFVLTFANRLTKAINSARF